MNNVWKISNFMKNVTEHSRNFFESTLLSFLSPCGVVNVDECLSWIEMLW
jgi:hypothetical protein